MDPWKNPPRHSMGLYVVLGTMAAGCLSGPDSNDHRHPGFVATGEATYHTTFYASSGSGSVELDETFRVSFVDEFAAFDENGKATSWKALTAVPIPEGPDNSVGFMVLDPKTGCPRGGGYDGSIHGPEGMTLRSRYATHLLGLQSQAVKFLKDGYQATSFLVVLGLVIRSSPEADHDLLREVLPASTVTRSDGGVVVRLPDPPSGGGSWRLEFSWAPDPGLDYPSRIGAFRESPDYSIPVAEVEIVSAVKGGLERAFSCAETSPFETPRIPPRMMDASEIPSSYPIPEVYTMAEAHDDARLVPEVQVYFGDHADARFWGAYATVYDVRADAASDAVTRRVTQWDVYFASPSNASLIQVDVRRETLLTANVTTPVPARFKGIMDNVQGIPEHAVWTQQPLVGIEDAVAWARQGGMNPSRTGWLEPPWDHKPLWRVEDYDPYYGSDPTSTRTSLLFDATTGWVLFSAFNTNE